MTQAYLAPLALLPAGWARDVRIEVGATGMVVGLELSAAARGAERLRGPLLPGMPNLHSHAFQRAMAGLTQKGGPAHDSFWSWREQMYRFLERIGPDELEAIAAQLYVEMLEAGYTSVAEFHYLHHDPQGRSYADPAEMVWRIVAAAAATGIGLTLLPVFYAHGQFGGEPPSAGQRRFVHTLHDFRELMQRLAGAAQGFRLGLAPHSLRAVTPEQLRLLLMMAPDPAAPIHIHAAEQQKEVQDSLRWSGRRPVAWLLENAVPDARWCLVHATHLDGGETVALARSGAVAGLCPSTEADLGDGLFNAAEFLGAGGHIGIGGDSHVGVDPFAELRLFEYGQRLRHERRNVLAAEPGTSLGERLFRAACAGGAQALAQPVGRIEPGARADWIVLNTHDRALIEQDEHSLLDAAIFGPARQPVRDVMVAGSWRVRDGRHERCGVIGERYRAVLRRLLA